MTQKIFINLPVKDLTRSTAFFTCLGFTFDPKFTDGNAACLAISDSISVMLVTESVFQTLTKKAIVDAHKATGSIMCLMMDSREQIDQMMVKALAAGGTAPQPAQDTGFMYDYGFEDLDGHFWGLAYMYGDPS